MKYRFTMGIGYVGCERDVIIDIEEETGMTDEVWNQLSEDEQNCELEEMWQDWSYQYIDGGWSKVD